MLTNADNLDLVYRGFSTDYKDCFDKAPSYYAKIAMTMPRTAQDETYGWIGQFQNLREWIGPRHVQNLTASTFTILNRKFEQTIAVTRDEISDDKLGIFKPMFAKLGLAAKQNPDKLVFELLHPALRRIAMTGSSISTPITRG